ncbi:hypothetical protein D9M69_640470 [compost metagenome]
MRDLCRGRLPPTICRTIGFAPSGAGVDPRLPKANTIQDFVDTGSCTRQFLQPETGRIIAGGKHEHHHFFQQYGLSVFE